MNQIDVFHIGPQKTATTWLYHCLKAHPEISAPSKDALHFFDINYHLGDDWLLSHFNHNSENFLIETTPSYIRSIAAQKRIKNYNPNAKIIFCARNPIDRMISHYWHEKKKLAINYSLEDVIHNYDLYNSWVETSLYGQHLKNLYDLFPKENILVQIYDDLLKDPKAFLKETYQFIGVEKTDYVPDFINNKINQATPQKTKKRLLTIKLLRRIGILDKIISARNKLMPPKTKNNYNTQDFKKEMPEYLKEHIQKSTYEDIKLFSRLIERDLVKEWEYQ